MNRPLLSLFCGAGGLDMGFRAAGFSTAVAIDNCPHAVRTFNRNAGTVVAHERDLASLDGAAFVAMIPNGVRPVGLIGGPPCQSFSRGNVHVRSDDPRHRLPYRYVDLLRAAKDEFDLHFFVFENVAGLGSERHARRLSLIRNRLIDVGFNVFQSELNALAFNVPQRRRRLFLVGLDAKRYPKVSFQFPTGDSNKATVADAIEDLPAPAFYRRGLTPETIPHHPNHWTMVPKSPKFENAKASDGRSFRRLAWDEPSPTVAYGHREIHVHPEGSRRLSVYEAMLLQGFPSSYELTGTLSAQVSQVSNAVPPPVAEAIARKLLAVLKLPAKRNPNRKKGRCHA